MKVRKFIIIISIALLLLLFIADKRKVGAENSADPGKSVIYADVAGAVAHPGVYALSIDSRIFNAIYSAGGFSKQADVWWVTKNINFAKQITDSEKIYIPYMWDDTKSSMIFFKSDNPPEKSTQKINVNNTSSAELTKLPGVGEIYAARIVDSGPYKDLNELKIKAKLPQNVIDQIKDLIEF